MMGAGGCIGDTGHWVRCMARSARRLRDQPWAGRVGIVEVDGTYGRQWRRLCAANRSRAPLGQSAAARRGRVDGGDRPGRRGGRGTVRPVRGDPSGGPGT
ncbi:hypothetical protein ETD96_00470 [Actinomadura geliboluensis]|uniref:Transposase n=1 Tax=Actinomadura geliboluensis TaxID=882440 RepID=A0A5S4HC06_9ACTN|nr:hypothetical protein ETD96_00470 [Actinomadura geliboluensis]